MSVPLGAAVPKAVRALSKSCAGPTALLSDDVGMSGGQKRDQEHQSFVVSVCFFFLLPVPPFLDR